MRRQCLLPYHVHVPGHRVVPHILHASSHLVLVWSVSVINKEFFLVWLRPPAFGREWLSFRGPVRRHLTMPQPRGSVAERGALDAISFVPEAKPLLQCLGLPSDMARMASSASAALLSAYSRLLAGALLLGPRVACLRKSSS